MIFDFKSWEPIRDKIIFVLMLDYRRNKERIIIGIENEVQRLLENKNGDVYYDKTSPLEQLLFNFESDPENEWDQNILELKRSYGRLMLKAPIIRPVKEFLNIKYDDNPIRVYTAIQAWNNYLIYQNEDGGPDKYLNLMSQLYKPFHKYTGVKIWETTFDITSDEDSKVEIWYPNQSRLNECIVVKNSFLPLIYYYLKRLDEWNLHFRECKICGVYFLARSNRYELCSDKCRSAQNTINKREHDARSKDNSAFVKYETEYGYWNYRMNKLRKNPDADPNQLRDAEEAFEKFKADNKLLKSDVNHKLISQKEYAEWLLRQRDIIDNLIEYI